jgi:hypothetical protein
MKQRTELEALQCQLLGKEEALVQATQTQVFVFEGDK